MGVNISLVKLSPIKNVDEWCSETFVLSGSERSLLPSEKIVYIWDDREIVSEILSAGYCSYGNFRRWLSVVALGKQPKEVWEEAAQLRDGEDYPHPLYHIINFADNEGEIGPAAIKILQPAFAELAKRVSQTRGVEISAMENYSKEDSARYIKILSKFSEVLNAQPITPDLYIQFS